MAKSGQIGYIGDMATQERPPDYKSQARIQRNIDQCAKAIGHQCSVIYLGFAKYGVKYFTWADK